jgi:hypothetical protein
LDIGEVKYLINVLWEFHPSKRCIAAMSKLDLNTDGVVTVEEFVLLSRHHYDLLRPVRDLQRHLQRKTVFRRFWRQITKRRVELFGTTSMYELCGYTDPAYVASSMEYLNLRTDIVPVQFVEQWNFIQRRKAARGTLHQDLPYEIKEILYPHPLNAHTKKTLRGVAKSIGLWSRYGKKNKSKGSKRNPKVAADQISDAGSTTEEAHNQDGEGSDYGDFDVDAGTGNVETFPRPAKKNAPFDDSYLKSLKGSKATDF